MFRSRTDPSVPGSDRQARLSSFTRPGVRPVRNRHPCQRRPLPLAMYLLAIGFTGCNRSPATAAVHPENPANVEPPSPSSAPLSSASADGSLADFARTLGAHCDDPNKGRDCVTGNMDTGDFYDIELSPNCSEYGFFAGISATEAPLLDTLPVTGSKARINAKLSQGQLVCVQATARTGQRPAYYYVIALSPSNVAACRNKPICNQHGDRQISFVARPPTGKACSRTIYGDHQGDCADGWVDAKWLDVFSDGL